MPDPFQNSDTGWDSQGFTGLRLKIGLAIVVVVAAISIASGVWDVYRARMRETARLKAEAAMHAERLARILARPMWEMDAENTAVILDAVMENMEIQAVLVNELTGNGDEEILLIGRMRDASWQVRPVSGDVGTKDFSAETAITLCPRGDEVRRLGTVKVFLSPRFMERYLADIMLEVGVKTFIILMFLAIILYFSLSKLVVAPLSRIMHGLERVRRGDLEARVEVESSDELGLLARSFNRMIAILKTYTDSLRASGGRMAEASAHIAGAAGELTRGAESQLEQVLTTSKGMENMHASIQEISRSAEKTSRRADEASGLARDGSVKVTRTVEGFNAANAVIKELNQRSQEIEQVVQFIGDIASQTNILALNAAIEAARAGEYGRGFDVVAEEIRKLAQRTTQSTTEISAMITDILHKTEQAATLMEKGSVWANSAGKALEDIVSGIVATSEMVQIISEVSTQQAATAETIATALHDISNVSRNSAQSSGSVAAAASDLAALAEQLSEDAAWARRSPDPAGDEGDAGEPEPEPETDEPRNG